uniref:Uncharacterized protein n=1 Tax=Peronospora matthiolae TaxID=2874970 RepID=A0AAV1VDZ5_9STRA
MRLKSDHLAMSLAGYMYRSLKSPSISVTTSQNAKLNLEAAPLDDERLAASPRPPFNLLWSTCISSPFKGRVVQSSVSAASRPAVAHVSHATHHIAAKQPIHPTASTSFSRRA